MTKKATARLSAAASAKLLEEVEEWRREAKASDQQVTRRTEELLQAQQRIRDMGKELDEARGKITEREKDLMGDLQSKERAVNKLKSKLFSCLQELWATKGYLARVAEDDAIRELGPSAPAPVSEARLPPPAPVSRRMGPGFLAPEEPAPVDPHAFGRDQRPPPTPWFNL